MDGARASIVVPDGYVVRMVGGAGVDPWLRSIDAQQVENGLDGVYFSPYSAHETRPPRAPDEVQGYAERFERPATEPGWLRVWLAFDLATGLAVGHADLAGPRLAAELHRAVLGMGIERAHHRRGLGRALLATAIAWAREEPSLAWIDLGVFSGNHKARPLYRSLGFVELGTTRDRFRVDGVSIDDVHMVLDVSRAPG